MWNGVGAEGKGIPKCISGGVIGRFWSFERGWHVWAERWLKGYDQRRFFVAEGCQGGFDIGPRLD
ncbi:origin recognition complex, subunit 4 [Sesbania bispinosa]|nr:origin recognition complex, subunit 4 [Sesbania bispinosa]